ncbi:MAG TPA: thioredoxin domain-containing protein [Pyrinomonadaceae bacterium]
MKYRKMFVTAALCTLALATTIAAQSTQSSSSSTPVKPSALATVNNDPITLADLDPSVSQKVQTLDQRIIESRRRVLDAMINERLFEVEAGRRRISVDRLLDVEAFDRINAPTNAEIQAFYDANRDKFGASPLETARPQIVSYLRGQSAQKLLSELVGRLRAAHRVVMGADPNAPQLAPSTVLATVAGRTITAGAFNERARLAAYDLRMEVYEAERGALELEINDRLLTAEARRRNVTEQEVIRTEVTAKMRPLTDADVDKFYAENRSRITGDLATIREDLRRYLEREEQQRLVAALVQTLRSGADIRLFLTEPEAPVQAISTDDDPSRGDPRAPVTVVMFTDFQCPTCAGMHPIIEEELKKYGARVRFVVRDFPLVIHHNARKAAEAAGAANAQGKFFEYIALLYKNQAALDVPSLKKYATEVGLNRARFDRELDGGVYAAEVRRDMLEGEKYGIRGTPAIFINGVRLRDITAEGLHAAMERAFAQVNRTTAR